VTPTTFDPTAHPPLTDLGARLRELAGDAAFRAGRDYLRKGRVQDGAVAGDSAHATVKGSTEYRVMVAFPTVETTRVSCTCPAHRRNKHCKHVVAVCTALLEQPATFAVLDALPAPPPTTKAPRRRGTTAKKPQPAEQRAAGLEVLDRLLIELTDGGLAQLGPDKVALIEQCAELVRALKLRRLGNLLMQLQRAVGAVGEVESSGTDRIDGAAFARLVVELYLCRAATGAQLEGRAALDPRLAEDLLGKTWRAEELELITGLELVQVASATERDAEFAVATSYLVDIGSLEVYAERQITPLQLRSAPMVQHHVRLLVEEAGLYPGLSTRRIRLGRFQLAALRAQDLDRLVRHAPDDLSAIQRGLVEQALVPFGRPEIATLFRPALLVGPADEEPPERQMARPKDRSQHMRTLGAVDRAGRFISFRLPIGLADDLAVVGRNPSTFALFGLVGLGSTGLTFRCFSMVVPGGSATSSGPLGRIVPEAW